jgi:phosphoglucosamine mutase
MSRTLFGTDGVRGRANTWPMTAEIALKLGAAAGRHFRRAGGEPHRVVIGKDTRLSGYMLETALTAGLCSTGMNVLLLGPVPTPAVGFLTRSMRADLGIMISASHNSAEDNGIKFFGPDGFKLSDADEAAIEALLPEENHLAQPHEIGRVRRIDDGLGRYVEYAKTTLPRAARLDGLKVVVDCAHGAAYKAAPQVLWELGAQVIPLGVSPDGLNINRGFGSTAPQACAERVVAEGADIGLCLDGDADRLVIIDERGEIADGDQILALLARRAAEAGRLAKGTLVTTVMSNLGLERFLTGRGLRLERTAVGDRYVVERMRAGGYNLGGEPSGHIVMTDHTTTGDGLIAALQVLHAMVETGERASELSRQFVPVPQLLRNVRLQPGCPAMDAPRVQAAIRQAEARLNGRGRLVIRKSGTEPLVRVMAECEDGALLAELVGEIVAELEAAA